MSSSALVPCSEDLHSDTSGDNSSIDNIPLETLTCDTSMSKKSDIFPKIRYSARKDSERSLEKVLSKDEQYWTINDDDDEIENASEADEESIESTIRGTKEFTFLNKTDKKHDDHVSSTTDTVDPIVHHSEISVEEKSVNNLDMTYKVVATKEKLTLEASLPTVDKPVLPFLNEKKRQWSLDTLINLIQEVSSRYQKLPFLRYRLYSLGLLLAGYFVLPGFCSGLLFGIYLSLMLFLFICVSEPIPPPLKQEPTAHVIDRVKELSVKEESVNKVYKGWMNILNEPYNPHTFHVNNLQTVLVRLDGNMLRISRPNVALLRHARYEDPTLINKEPTMISQSIYDLTNAVVKLRPERLAKRRWYTRRYPICITLANVDSEIHSRNEDRYLMSQTKVLEGFTKDSSEEKTGILSKVFGKKRSRKASESTSQSSNSLQNSENLETSVNDDECPSMAERVTLGTIDRCKEVDGYETDTELYEEDGNVFGVQKSHSAENLRRGSFTKLQRNFPGPTSRATRKIFLFARSCREKEKWFHKLRKACSRYNEPKKGNKGRKSSLPSSVNTSYGMTMEYFLYIFHHLQYSKHLDDILTNGYDLRSREEKGDDFGTVYMDLGRQKWKKPEQRASNEFVVLANLLATRIFYDFCRDSYWCEQVRNKIQTKLASIHLPYFIETLELSKFDIGTAIPKIYQVYAPTVDDWGTWVDFDIEYIGCIKLVLETKVNLMKLKNITDSIPEEGNDITPSQLYTLKKSPSRYSDEDIPESPESSADEEFGKKMKYHETETAKTKTGKKILNFVEKVAHSKYFKEASEMKPIKKMMEEISSTRLMLNVEVTQLGGLLTINISPPPSDRLWYGFREPPQMSIKAIPQVGGRTVVFSTISDWIESKLRLVLEKNLVVPNLDDIIIPVMSGNELISGPLNM